MNIQDSMYTSNQFINKSISFIIILLKGIGQIMLQENAITGLLFLIGITLGSPKMGLAALVATLCGKLTAIVGKYNKDDIKKGLYGFNAELVGVASMLFLKPVLTSWLMLIVGAILTSLLYRFSIKIKIKVFTLPFVIITWIILLISIAYFNQIMIESSTTAHLSKGYFSFAFKGFGQVIFQEHLLAGILFFIAVFISSPLSALYGIAAAIASATIASYCSASTHDVLNGLFSFNAVLCAIVLAGNQIQDGIWIAIAIALALAVQFALLHFSIPPLTFPFVAATLLILFMKSKLLSRVKN